MSLYPGDRPDNPNGHLDRPSGAFGQPTAARVYTAKDWFIFIAGLVLTGAAIAYAMHLTHKQR